MPSSGVSRCLRIVAGTSVPSADGNDRCSPTYAAESKPGASLRSRSVRSPVARSRSDHTGGIRYDSSTTMIRSRSCSTLRLSGASSDAMSDTGRTTMPSPVRSSSGRIRSWLRPSVREVSTTCPTYASTCSSRSDGSSGRSGSHAAESWSPERGTGQRASRNSLASSLVTSSSSSEPSAYRTCSAWYSTPRRRPPTERGTEVGSAASSTHTSLVSRFSDQMTTRSPVRLASTSSSNWPSGSSSTSSSADAGVPSRCRQTWCCRHSSSWTR